eukprot:GHVU01178230.1.p1 GENE.GHVU01178230.1~~GHVU01178230.1.p1  ORF type:complete len:134 (-),score=7.27 GHVU01178230.1:301-702(-)
MSPGTPTANTHQHDTYHNLSLSRTPAVGGGLTSVRCNGVGCDVNVTRRHRSGTHYLIHFWDGKDPIQLDSYLILGANLKAAAFASVERYLNSEQSEEKWRVLDNHLKEVGNDATVTKTDNGDTQLLLLRGDGR